MRGTQNGNALWFILIAILLLGLLTAMMTRSGSSTNETGEYERNSISASEIISYTKSIENGLQALLSRGCSENELSFEASNNTGYTNTTAPSDESCHLFSEKGAGLSFTEPSADITAQNWQITGYSQIDDIPQAGSSNSDLIIYLSGLESDFCQTINQNLKLSWPSPAIEGDSDFLSNTLFTGSFDNTLDAIDCDGGGAQGCNATPSACIQSTSGDAHLDNHVFYHVIYAR